MTYDALTTTIKKERKMLNFQRLAGTRKIRSYNLAEHSYFVGLLFQDLADMLGIKYSVDTLRVVMRHDFMEVFTTDLPYQVKNQNAITKRAWAEIESEAYCKAHNKGIRNVFSDKDIENTLTPEQYYLLKWCDLLELALFCLEEQAMGNRGHDIRAVLDNCETLFKSGSFLSSYKWGEKLLNIFYRFVEDYTI